MRGRRGQRGGRGRGRVRGQAFPPRKVTDQEIDNEDSRPPTPQPQDGEPLELEGEDDTVPAPAPRTLARLPSMPLQVSLRARKGLQNNSADSETSKDILNNADAPNTPVTIETSGPDGSSPEEEEDRPAKRRRMENGIVANPTPVAVDATVPPTRGRGRGRGRARGSRARGIDVGRGRGRGRARGRGSRGGPGSRGGRGAYRTRASRARGGRGGIAKTLVGPADMLLEKSQEYKNEGAATTTNDWYSGVTGSSYRNPSYSTISLIQEKKVKLITESASLEDLKNRHSTLKDRFKNVAKLMMARDYTRASKTLKELKNGRDLVNQAPWAKEIYQELEEKLETHLNHLEDELAFKQVNAVQVFDASLKIVQRSFEISMGEMMDHCVVAFIRENRDISQLWEVRDPYLNSWILSKCGVNRIDKVTMTDLVENFMPQVREGRDCSSYDRPQIASRTNQGFFDRKVRETWTARARKLFGEIINREKDSLITPPQSPRLEQNDMNMEIDEQALEGILAHQSVLDRNRENDKPEIAKVRFVLDHKYDPKNPGHVPPPRRLTTREFLAIDTLNHLREGIEFSDSDSDEYSDGGDYEANDEIMSVDEHLLKQGNLDGSLENDYGKADEKWLRIVAQVRKKHGGLMSKPRRSLGDDGGRSEKGDEVQSGHRVESLPEQPRSRSPSSGPLTSKHFDFVLTSETTSQSPAPVGPSRVIEENQGESIMFASHMGYSESPIHSGKTNGYIQDKPVSYPTSVPRNGPPSKLTNIYTPSKRARDGSGKEAPQEINVLGHKYSHSNLPENPNYGTVKPQHHFASRIIDRSKYYVAPNTGDDSTTRPFMGDGNSVPTHPGGNGLIVSGNLGPRPIPKSFISPPGFAPILKSSSSTLTPSGTDGPKPPRRTYKPRGSKSKEPGKPGRKPNNGNNLAGYSNSEFSLQGKGRILSPKPPTSSQMNYPPSGYPPPKFALPPNSPASSSYLKQRTASSTPSPLRSQSRPPHNPRDILNPLWASNSYTYGGPNPPQLQFQPSNDYSIDLPRSSVLQTSYQPSPGYASYNMPPNSTPIRSTLGAPPPHPFLPTNSTPTTFGGQSLYYTSSPGYPPPPAYVRPYPPQWNSQIPSSAPVLPGGILANSYEAKSPPQFIRGPTAPQEPIKYYVGDGVYKTAPSTIERQRSLPPPSQGTVFEEDSYSKDLNQLARNGNWGSGGKPGIGPAAPV